MVAYAVEILKQAGLADEFQDAFLTHKAPESMAYAISELNYAKLLEPELLYIVLAHDLPDQMAIACLRLHQTKILTSANIAFLQQAKDTTLFATALVKLHDQKIMTEKNIQWLLQHDKPLTLAKALGWLEQAKLSTDEAIAIVLKHPQLIPFNDVLEMLTMISMLTIEHLLWVAGHAHLENLLSIMKLLYRRGLFTAENFISITHAQFSILLTAEAKTQIWQRIPVHMITQDLFRHFCDASAQVNPWQRLLVLRDLVLGVEPSETPFGLLNPRQSTHTFSIHHSVSLSAKRLQDIYGDALDVSISLKAMARFIESLPSTLMTQAAARCLHRIESAALDFVDPASGISIAQLLALAYQAIHDEEQCMASRFDAQILLVEGLYEIQRGYHLSASETEEDLPICASGSFNKIIEKLTGMHLAVSLRYITHTGAAMKCPKVIDQHVLDYLSDLAQARTVADFVAVSGLIEQIKQDGSIDGVWGILRPMVEQALWDEFHEAYEENRSHPKFQALMAAGGDRQPPNLDRVQAILLRSSGYHAAIKTSFWSSAEKIDELRHATEKNTCIITKTPSK